MSDTPTTTSRLPWTRHSFAIGLFLFLVVALTYLPVLRCGFVTFDDDSYVYNNTHVQHGLNADSVEWALTTRLNGSWHPLTWISILLDCQLYGLRPAGHHFTNVLIHALTTVLVFALFRSMTNSLGRSVFVALVFGLHPLHVESVAWVSERKDVLCAFFWMLSLLMYVPYARKGLPVFYILCLLFFGCGLMSKPMIVTLPFLLLLMDWWPLGRLAMPGSPGTPARRYTGLFLEKLPFLILAGLCSTATLSGQRSAGAMMSTADSPVAIRVMNALLSLSSYLRQSVWPSGLAIYYPYPKIINIWKLGAAGLLVLGLSLLCYNQARRRPALAFGWLWFLLTLLPVIGLIQVGGQAHADRYMYVPLIGLSVMAAWTIPDLLQRFNHGSLIDFSLAGVVLACALLLTIRQLGFWTDSESLYRRALGVTYNNAVAENNLGDVLLTKGKYEESIQHSREALRITPSFPAPHYNIGEALAGEGRLAEAIAQYRDSLSHYEANADIYERFGRILSLKCEMREAIAQFDKALSLEPNHPQAHCEMGIALVKLQRFDDAIPHFEEAVRLLPEYLVARANLGAIYGRQGKYQEAIAQFREVLRLKPRDPIVHCNLADALAALGLAAEAIQEYQAALELAPSDAVAHRNLAALLTKQGRVDEAIEHLEAAIKKMPMDSRGHSELGIALGRKGRFDDAIQQFHQAIALDTNNVDALCNLGVALGAKGDLDDAIHYLEIAIAIKPSYTNAINNLQLARGIKKSSAKKAP